MEFEDPHQQHARCTDTRNGKRRPVAYHWHVQWPPSWRLQVKFKSPLAGGGGAYCGGRPACFIAFVVNKDSYILTTFNSFVSHIYSNTFGTPSRRPLRSQTQRLRTAWWDCLVMQGAPVSYTATKSRTLHSASPTRVDIAFSPLPGAVPAAAQS